MLRWIKRIAFGLVALVALAVVGGIAFFNTDYGRDKLRGELVSKLNDTFAFGATVGRVEGSPFGELTLYEVVINGPDGKPAIMVGTLRLRLRLIDLMSKDVRLGEVLAEDVDIQLRRDKEGRTTWSQLLKRNVQATDPPPPPTQRTWNIDLPAIDAMKPTYANAGSSGWALSLDYPDHRLYASSSLGTAGSSAPCSPCR